VVRATTRPATAADAPGVAALRARVLPHLVRSEGAVRHRLARASDDGPVRWRVATLPGGEVVAVAAVVTDAGERAWLELLVAPEHRRRGLGTTLLAWAVDVTGEQPLEAVAEDSPDGIAAVRAWGLAPSAPVQFSRTDPRGVAPVVPDGVRLTPLDGRAVDPARVHALLAASAPDDPSGLSLVRPLPQWLDDVWGDPDHEPALGTAAWDGEELGAVTMVDADRATGRIWSGATATRRDARGRGLALAVKSASLARAAAAGCTSAWTGNASGNAPMLAVNRRLGYEVAARGWVVHGEPRDLRRALR
jgi:GNAT superfamily N-acetyltransferase